jgi:hypothetical protein
MIWSGFHEVVSVLVAGGMRSSLRGLGLGARKENFA